MIGRRVGHFVIEEILGQGGMATVYRAQDKNLMRKVAIKVVTRQGAASWKRVFREAQAASALNHPNIVTIFELGETECMDFIVMEMVEGEDLATLLAHRKPTLAETQNWMKQICDGMAAAHKVGILHRDLKPANIMVTKDARIKILDFGLALHCGDKPEDRIVGTVAYMSPEQGRCEPLTAASDVFSLGAILFELVCGKRPFEGESAMSVLGAILYSNPFEKLKAGPQVPTEIRGVLEKALAKETAGRYADATELRKALEGARWEDSWPRAMLEMVGLLKRKTPTG
jgi:eukaryotic-like serine/threonine-protein kinase